MLRWTPVEMPNTPSHEETRHNTEATTDDLGLTPGTVSYVGSQRFCSRNGCRGLAVSTLTYNYADSTAVLGPMSQRAEPHAFDLCDHHSRELTAPVGWELLRLNGDEVPVRSSRQASRRNPDDLLAVADAVASDPEETRPRESLSESEERRRGRHVAEGPSVDRRPEPMSSEGPAYPNYPDPPRRNRPHLRVLHPDD